MGSIIKGGNLKNFIRFIPRNFFFNFIFFSQIIFDPSPKLTFRYISRHLSGFWQFYEILYFDMFFKMKFWTKMSSKYFFTPWKFFGTIEIRTRVPSYADQTTTQRRTNFWSIRIRTHDLRILWPPTKTSRKTNFRPHRVSNPWPPSHLTNY